MDSRINNLEFTLDIIMNSSLMELIQKRHSGYSYNPNKNVSDEHILALQEAARWAPSCFGEEPWRYIICSKDKHVSGWNNIYNSLVEKNQKWAQNANILIATICKNKFTYNDAENKHAAHDLGAANISMMLIATELGLMAHQMAGFSTDKLKESFNISDEYSPISIMAIGYELEQEESQTKPRVRKEMDDLFHLGTWI